MFCESELLGIVVKQFKFKHVPQANFLLKVLLYMYNLLYVHQTTVSCHNASQTDLYYPY